MRIKTYYKASLKYKLHDIKHKLRIYNGERLGSTQQIVLIITDVTTTPSANSLLRRKFVLTALASATKTGHGSNGSATATQYGGSSQLGIRGTTKVPVFMEPEVNCRVHKAPPLGLTQSENQIRNFTRSFNETILII
jgi:hypothetical protein